MNGKKKKISETILVSDPNLLNTSNTTTQAKPQIVYKGIFMQAF